MSGSMMSIGGGFGFGRSMMGLGLKKHPAVGKMQKRMHEIIAYSKGLADSCKIAGDVEVDEKYGDETHRMLKKVVNWFVQGCYPSYRIAFATGNDIDTNGPNAVRPMLILSKFSRDSTADLVDGFQLSSAEVDDIQLAWHEWLDAKEQGEDTSGGGSGGDGGGPDEELSPPPIPQEESFPWAALVVGAIIIGAGAYIIYES